MAGMARSVGGLARDRGIRPGHGSLRDPTGQGRHGRVRSELPQRPHRAGRPAAGHRRHRVQLPVRSHHGAPTRGRPHRACHRTTRAPATRPRRTSSSAYPAATTSSRASRSADSTTCPAWGTRAPTSFCSLVTGHDMPGMAIGKARQCLARRRLSRRPRSAHRGRPLRADLPGGAQRAAPGGRERPGRSTGSEGRPRRHRHPPGRVPRPVGRRLRGPAIDGPAVSVDRATGR